MAKQVKLNKLYIKHRAAIAGGKIGKPFVRGMKAALNAEARRSHGYDSTSPKIDAASLAILQNLLATRAVGVDEQLTAQGIAWLLSRKVRKELGDRERAICDNFKRYECRGFYDAGRNGWGYHVPIWRVVAKNGASFEYYAGSWQSGVSISVIG